MTKQQAIKSLESIISKLIHLNAKIEGNQLQDAINKVAYVRDKAEQGQLKIKLKPAN